MVGALDNMMILAVHFGWLEPESFRLLLGLRIFCFRCSVALFDAPGIFRYRNKLFLSSPRLCLIIVHLYLSLVLRKPVFGVSDQV